MCGQVGYFLGRMSRADWADAMEDMKHLQEILDSHNPTGSRCWAILQENPGEMIQAQFGYYREYREKLSWHFNVRCKGGFHNQNEDPNYDGPWEIFTNPFASENPLVIPSKRIYDWLDPELTKDQIVSFFGPFDSSGFETFEVDTVIAKKVLPVPVDDPKLITPISGVYPG